MTPQTSRNVQAGLFGDVAISGVDAYYTRLPDAERVVSVLPIADGDTVIEPSVGAGAWPITIRRRFPKVGRIAGVDVNPLAEGQRFVDDFIVGDFLTLPIVGRFDWSVGNPPYVGPDDQADLGALAHVTRSLEIADNVVALLRAGFIESDARKVFWDRHPARHTWFIRQRVQFGNEEAWRTSKKASGNSHLMAMFWWDQAWSGPSTWSILDLHRGPEDLAR